MFADLLRFEFRLLFAVAAVCDRRKLQTNPKPSLSKIQCSLSGTGQNPPSRHLIERDGPPLPGRRSDTPEERPLFREVTGPLLAE